MGLASTADKTRTRGREGTGAALRSLRSLSRSRSSRLLSTEKKRERLPVTMVTDDGKPAKRRTGTWRPKNCTGTCPLLKGKSGFHALGRQFGRKKAVWELHYPVTE